MLYCNSEKVFLMLDAMKRTMQRYRLKEMLTSVKVGGSYSYKAADVEALFNKKTITSQFLIIDNPYSHLHNGYNFLTKEWDSKKGFS